MTAFKFVSKLDLLEFSAGFPHRTKMLSAFVTPKGLYQYKVLPLRLINQLTQDLEACEGYIGDIIILP